MAEEVEERLARLEAENAALRSQVAAPPAPRKPRGRGWTVLATVLIVLGCLLAPVAVVSGWAKVLLTDTDAFVETYAPLAEDPEVQAFVVAQVMAVVEEQVSLDQLTTEVVDGLTQLGLSPRAAQALRRLQAPAAQGLHSLIERQVEAVVSSDAFPAVWERALRATHTQLLATLQQDPGAVVAANNGTVGIQIGPIMDAVKAALVANGLDFAAQIPTVNRTIPIAQSDALPEIGFGYRLVLALGSWLPWVVLGLLAAGVLVARRRSLALVWAAIGLALSAGLVLVALATGRELLPTIIPASQVPTAVTSLLYATVTDYMRDTAAILLLLAVVVAVVGWLAGPFATPRRLRSFYGDGVAVLRRSAGQHGVTTGRVGSWLYRQRSAIHVLVAVGGAAIVLFVRPLTPGVILGTLAGAVVVLIVLSLLERPPSDSAPATESATPATASG